MRRVRALRRSSERAHDVVVAPVVDGTVKVPRDAHHSLHVHHSDEALNVAVRVQLPDAPLRKPHAVLRPMSAPSDRRAIAAGQFEGHTLQPISPVRIGLTRGCIV